MKAILKTFYIKVVFNFYRHSIHFVIHPFLFRFNLHCFNLRYGMFGIFSVYVHENWPLED